MRNLRSDSFVTAGITTAVAGEEAYPIGGGVFNAPDELKRGDSYSADVYTPEPTERQLRDDPAIDYQDWLRYYLAIYMPDGVATAVGDPDERPQRAGPGRVPALGRRRRAASPSASASTRGRPSGS